MLTFKEFLESERFDKPTPQTGRGPSIPKGLYQKPDRVPLGTTEPWTPSGPSSGPLPGEAQSPPRSTGNFSAECGKKGKKKK